MSSQRELLDRIAYLESDRDFWKDQQKLAANVAATIADLDEEAPALRQLLRREGDRRKKAESALVAAEAERDGLRGKVEAVRTLCELDDLRPNDTVGAYAVDLAQEIRRILDGER